MRRMILNLMLFFVIVTFTVGCGNDNYESEDLTEEVMEEEIKEVVSYLDVTALEELEKRDDFPVRVLDKQLDHQNLTSSGDDEEDVIRLAVSNETGYDIEEFTIYSIAYTADEQKVQTCREGEIIGEDKVMAHIGKNYEGFPNGTISENVIRCNLDDFYDVKVIIGDYITEDGSYYENPLLEEWIDIVDYGTGKEVEESLGGPNPDEYSEIVLNDNRYYLCKKIESGFDTNAVYYGIYDAKLQEWTVEYMQLYDEDKRIEFENLGEGVFSYFDDHFMSSDLGGCFDYKLEWGNADVKFVNKVAHIIIEHDTQNGPDCLMVKVDTYGESEEIKIAGLESEDIYWNYSSVVTPRNNSDVYAKIFTTKDDKQYMYIYLCDEQKYIIIDEQKYTSRFIQQMGESSFNTTVTLEGDIIHIENLEGDDEYTYYIEYDKDGNLITDVTKMEYQWE